LTLNGLITGCGRSGTSYLADVLNVSGASCGHEAAYDVFGQHHSSHRFESSWYAAPFLDQLPPRTPIVHLVRDPVRVIQSFHRLGLLSKRPFRHVTYGRTGFHPKAWMLYRRQVRDRWHFVLEHRRFLERHLAVWSEHDEVQRLVTYWFRWNQMVEDNAAHLNLPYLRVRLEDLDQRLNDVAEFLGVDPILDRRSPTNTKMGYKPRPVPEVELSEQALLLANRFGYSGK
jgi:hypothetical protein